MGKGRCPPIVAQIRPVGGFWVAAFTVAKLHHRFRSSQCGMGSDCIHGAKDGNRDIPNSDSPELGNTPRRGKTMKKILLATSVLAASAGFASAEGVTVTGTARMGLVYNSANNDDVFFSSRVRVKFEMMGTTDGGLEFGASVRADQYGGHNTKDSDGDTVGNTGNTNGDSTVYIKGAFGKLTMGDVGGAADALVGQVSGVGYGPNDSLQEIDFVGTTKTAVYYEYSNGPLTFGLGVGQTRTGDEYNAAVKYSTDAFSVALGYENDGSDRTQISLLGSATFNTATVKAKLVDDDNNDDLMYALSLDYVAGPGTYTAFYTDFGDTNVQHVGLGAAYDLGGGAAVKAGVVRQMNPGADETFADVGITMSF
jgi:outer membrane protein OmpU